MLSRLCARTVSNKISRSTLSYPGTDAMSAAHVDVESVRNDMLYTEAPAAHFNSAGASPMPRTVLDRVTKHLELEATLGGYEAAAQCDDELEAVYESAARLINADADEIALQVLWGTP